MPVTPSISRLRATDAPLARMSDAEIDRLVEIKAFDTLDPEFRRSPVFRRILAKDTRPVDFGEGDIIIREGDWGNTAYFVLSGSVLIVLEPPGKGLSGEILGRRERQRKTLLGALAQLWTNHRVPEYRDQRTYQAQKQTGQRGSGEQTRIYLQDVPGLMAKHETLELGRGELFGELAALGRTARTATVLAKNRVELLEIRWQGLRDLMRKDTGFRHHIDKTFRENALRNFLLHSAPFGHLKDDEAAVAELVAGARLEFFGEYDKVGSFRDVARQGSEGALESEPVIAREGDYPNGVIMIRNGLARVSRRHHHGHLTVSYLGPGGVYGWEEILGGHEDGEPVALQHSLRAVGFVTAVSVPTPLVEKHLLGRRDAREPAGQAHGGPPAVGLPLIDTGRISQEFIEFLVQGRFAIGTETMLIDLDRCTRCDDCVRACAAAHDNNPRFVRQGPVSAGNNVMVANACMHCQDPVCMIECPTGAIGRDEDTGVVTINDTTCIGCSTCANNCPFDAIRMVEIRDEHGAFIRDANTQQPIPKATKCDLCVDQRGGPACQRACPHDALVRIDMREFEKMGGWLDR